MNDEMTFKAWVARRGRWFRAPYALACICIAIALLIFGCALATISTLLHLIYSGVPRAIKQAWKDFPARTMANLFVFFWRIGTHRKIEPF